MKSYYTNIIEAEFMFQKRAYIGRVHVAHFRMFQQITFNLVCLFLYLYHSACNEF